MLFIAPDFYRCCKPLPIFYVCWGEGIEVAEKERVTSFTFFKGDSNGIEQSLDILNIWAPIA